MNFLFARDIGYNTPGPGTGELGGEEMGGF